MPVQAPQWSEYLSCPVCQNEFEVSKRPPISLGCGHTTCRTCLENLQRRQCPFDQTPISVELSALPVNTALLRLIGTGEVPDQFRTKPDLNPDHLAHYADSLQCIEQLAGYLRPAANGQLSRPMQRKLVTLVNCQLVEKEGRARAARAARSLGERSVTELILQHQNPQLLSANLWAAVRARGCQFLGPAMQEEVLKLVLLALEDGSALSRKVLVMFVVQRLEPHFPQASKTSIGHVVQLLYRASCFKVTKRDGDSSLMQLKEEFRTYETLRREHDTQIVQIATEGGLRIAPDQWSSLLYGDTAHKSHMQSIIDKLQTPQSFGQSVQELVIALQRTGDPGGLSALRSQLDCLTEIDPSPESECPEWEEVVSSLEAAQAVVAGLVGFVNLSGGRKSGNGDQHGGLVRYKTSMCRDLSAHGSCPRGANCTFAHSHAEVEIHRNGSKKPKPRELVKPNVTSVGQSVATKGNPAMAVLARAKVRPFLNSSKQNDSEEQKSDAKPFVNTMLDVPAQTPPVAQVAPIPRVGCLPPPEIQYDAVPHGAALVDVHGTPMIDAATGQPLIAAPMPQQPPVYQAPVHIAGADGGLYQVQPATPIQLIGQGLQVGHHGQGATLQITPQGAIAVGQPMGAMQTINITPSPLQQIHFMQNAMVPSPGMRPTFQPNYEHPSPQRRKSKQDLSPEIASKSLSALKDRKNEIIEELGTIVGTQAAHTISEMALQHATANHKIGVDYNPPEVPKNRPKEEECQSMDNTYGMWTTKPIVTMNNIRDRSRNVSAAEENADEDDLKPLPEGICVSRFGPISRKPIFIETASAEPCAVQSQLGPLTKPTPVLGRPLPATSPGLPQMNGLDQEQSYNFDALPNPSDFVIVEGMDSVAMNHLVNPPCMPQSPMPNPRDQLTSLSSQNLNLYAQSARMKKELSDLQAKISSLNVLSSENCNMAGDRDRLVMELRMIEQGIRERHQEISENQVHPTSTLGRLVPGKQLGVVGNEDHHNMQRGYADQFNKPSQENVTEYNYW